MSIAGMPRIAALALALLLPALAGASADDFARGRTIEPTTAGPLERIRLPQDVYEWTTREDLGDVRVLNGAGDEVPYALWSPAPPSASAEWRTLPLFALPGRAAADSRTDVRIELARDGTIIAVHDRPPPADTAPSGSGPAVQAPDDAARAWLVDLGDLADRPLELRLQPAEGSGDLVARIRIETSTDLDRWQPMGATFAIARLHAGTASVIRDVVELPAPGARYLRVTCADSSSTLTLAGVTGRVREALQPARDVKLLAATTTPYGWTFDAGGHFPIDRVRVSLDQDTYLVRARIASRARSDDPWLEHGEHAFYQVDGAGLRAAGDPAALVVTTHRFWRIQWADATTAEPRLEIAWIPRDLLFVKQGDAPFTLVYGRGGFAGNPWPMQDLLGQLDTRLDPEGLAPATLQAPRLLGGPDRLAPPPRAIDWQTVLLWSVLCISVVVIVFLAIRLAR
jgi:hypothetical protein